ncbi:MAG TPA: hypothetical protein VJU61_19965 [Polyangiaceae bacterium]|nr:hypothetical protein [Polyangiaceae bacterium]
MGSHIHVFLPRILQVDADRAGALLNELAQQYAAEHDALGQGMSWSSSGSWWCQRVDDPPDPPYITGEGPAGLLVNICEHVVVFSSVHRFFTLYDSDAGFTYHGEAPSRALKRTLSLRTIIEAVALLFGDGRLAVAAGGGDTDEAVSLVHEEAVTFPQVCEALERSLGRAATTWSELVDCGWFARTAV